MHTYFVFWAFWNVTDLEYLISIVYTLNNTFYNFIILNIGNSALNNKIYCPYTIIRGAGSSVNMVQMGAMRTTITETEMLQQEMEPLKNVMEEEVTTLDKDSLPVSKQEIIWKNVIMITLLHILAVISFITHVTCIKYQTIIWGKFGPPFIK